MRYLKLFNFPILIGILLGPILIQFTLLKAFNIPTSLNSFQFILYLIGIISIVGAGQVANNIYRVEQQKLALGIREIKGNIFALKNLFRIFFTLNIIGVGIGFYIANTIDHPGYTALFITASLLLYACSKPFKKYALLRPLSYSFLMGLNIIGLGIIALVPVINPQNQPTLTTFFSLIKDFAILLFLLTLLFQFLKAQKNIDRDHRIGQKSLALIIGKTRMNKGISFYILIPIFSICLYLVDYLYQQIFLLLYALVFLIGPLFYLLFKIINAETKKEYTKLTLVSKGILCFGLLSIALYSFLLK